MKAISLVRAAAAVCVILAATLAAGASRAGTGEAIPVPVVTIYPGDTISDNMLSDHMFRAGTSRRFPVIADRAALVGKVARRTLLPGRPIARNAVAEPDVVERGTIVRAVFSRDGLVITTPVLALQSGSLNAMIQVRNVDSGKVIVGTVAADGTVRVGGP